MLLPVVALCAWTTVMWVWMFALRLPAIKASRMKLDPNAPRGEQMASFAPHVRWKADNYNHLMEQPTYFYAIAIVLALIPGTQLDVYLAWAYVGFRVVHSLIQALWNKIEVRFAAYFLGSLVLAGMIVHAGLLLL